MYSLWIYQLKAAVIFYAGLYYIDCSHRVLFSLLHAYVLQKILH